MTSKTTNFRTDMGTWVLPLPPAPESKYSAEWERIPAIGWTKTEVPFGYILDPAEPTWLLPVPRQLELLELAKEYLKRYSYPKVAAWLSAQSGRMIKPQVLNKRVQIDKNRKTLIAIKRAYAEELQRVINDLETLEHKRVGAKAGAAK